MHEAGRSAPTGEAADLAEELWRGARDEEQCVRVIPDDRLAEDVRVLVRALAAADRVRIRTARMGDTVAAVRLDAVVWHEDAATMRHTLRPPQP